MNAPWSGAAMAMTATYTRRTPEQSIFYKAFKKQWPIIRAMCRAANDGHGLPVFIEKAADNYLKCGKGTGINSFFQNLLIPVPKHGFVYAKCDRCEESIAVALSCKQRGLCNSCDTRRGIAMSAHLVDEVIPHVKIRQWVITFPHDLRYLLAWKKDLRSWVLAAVMRALERHYVAQALAKGCKDPKFAAISVAQRFDSAIRLNCHWHILCADGVWVQTTEGLKFRQAPKLKPHVLEAVFADVRKRIDRQLRKLPEPIEEPEKLMEGSNPALTAILKSAMLGHQLQGKDKGKQQRVEFGKAQLTEIHSKGYNCVNADGYSLHADRVVRPHDRQGLESLCNYLCRPAFAASRLSQLEDGTIRVSLKSVWKGNVIAVFLSAYELVVRVLAQIPLPFCASTHYHGCFAGNSKMRANVVPAGNKAKARRKKSLTEKDDTTKMTWHDAMKRAHKFEVLNCPCGGIRRVIAAVQDKIEIERFLRHLHLWPDEGEILSVRGPPELWDFEASERADAWGEVYELEAQMAYDEDWAA